jgi:hypothetical protein
MAKFDEKAILGQFESNLKTAKGSLASLEFCCSEEPSFQGLSGWIFEQTVQDCLRKELKALGIRAEIQEQASLGGRAAVDLLIGSAVAIEIKAKGLFDRNAASRYCKYRVAAEERGYCYLYLTLQESYLPYRKAMLEALGQENTFFLDTPGDWSRLVKRAIQLLTNCRQPNRVAGANAAGGS